MISGTVGAAPAAEFSLLADEISATVQIEAMLATPRAERAVLYPGTLHGLTALVYGLIGAATRETLPTAIEILSDMRHMKDGVGRGLPIADLIAFGFELLIGKAMEKGWAEVFATSDAFADYAAERQAAGLP
jgi:hypothetical protein